jgi:hypothetical protein
MAQLEDQVRELRRALEGHEAWPTATLMEPPALSEQGDIRRRGASVVALMITDAADRLLAKLLGEGEIFISYVERRATMNVASCKRLLETSERLGRVVTTVMSDTIRRLSRDINEKAKKLIGFWRLFLSPTFQNPSSQVWVFW